MGCEVEIEVKVEIGRSRGRVNMCGKDVERDQRVNMCGKDVERDERKRESVGSCFKERSHIQRE